MDKQSDDPAMLPDVATEPHPVSPPAASVPAAGENVLQEALPEVSEAARKVGGYKKLAEIAKQLGDAEAGQ
jgi:hypothetical protein